MKKLFPPLLTLLFALMAVSSFAQYCGNSGPAICTPGGPYSQLGFYPPYDSLPCAVIGTPYSQKVDLQVPATFLYSGLNVTIDSIKVNSISNLPCGLCWATNRTNNAFHGNSAGCVYVSGTTYDAAGQYKMAINIDVWGHYSVISQHLSSQDAESFGIRYYARVMAPGGNCIAVDTNAVGNTATTSGSITTPSITGNATICSGGNTTLSVSGTYQTYVWSTGALTSSINISQPGTYTVTVYDHCTSATASQVVTGGTPVATITASGPTTFCQGGSVVLTAASGNTSYAWSTGSSTDSIHVGQAGTYSVTVTNAGCTASSSQVVNVTSNNLSPVITPAVANICTGGTATLDAGSGFDSYSWSNSSSTETITSNTQATYTVTVTLGTCSGTATATVNVGNFTVPVSITPGGTINRCEGDTVTLDGGTGFSAYNWSTGDNGQSIQVSSSGTFILTVTQPSACTGVDSVIANFAPLPNPAITPSTTQTICSNQHVILTAASGYSSYLWSNGATTSSVVITNSGSYSVTATQSGCSGAAGPVQVIANPAPFAHIDSNYLDGSAQVHLVVGNTNFTDHYQWLNTNDTTGSLNTVGPDSAAYTYLCSSQGGYFAVIQSNSDGCVDTSNFVFESICEGVPSIAYINNFNVRPNPAKDQLHISFNMEQSAEVEINIVDLSGRKVLTIVNEKLAEGSYQKQIDVSALAQGIYMINFMSQNGSLNTKFVKE